MKITHIIIGNDRGENPENPLLRLQCSNNNESGINLMIRQRGIYDSILYEISIADEYLTQYDLQKVAESGIIHQFRYV